MRLLAWLVLPFAMLVRAYRRHRSSPIVMFDDGKLKRVEWRGKTYVGAEDYMGQGTAVRTDWYCEQDGVGISSDAVRTRLNGAIHAYRIGKRVDAAVMGIPQIEAPKEALTAPTPKTLPDEAFKDTHGNACLRWKGRVYIYVHPKWLYGETLKSVDDAEWLRVHGKHAELVAEQKLREQIRKQGLRPMS